MTTTRGYGERRTTAFMEDPDNMDIGNIIHANGGARQYGYRAALVPGVTVYGWSVPAILQAAGEEWLDQGWVDVSLRRPTYPGDEVIARVAERDDGAFDLAVTNQDGETVVSGEAGLGSAPWLDELRIPSRRTAEPRPETMPRLTPEVAPVGQDLRPMAVPLSVADARDYALKQQGDDNALFAGKAPLWHPAWIAALMTRLIHHSYDYGPAIHARSQIQNLRRAEAGQVVTVAGHFRDAFERKGHHYAVVDGLVLAEDGTEVARLRHTTIFQVAKREGPA